jgi:hypothetical protein
MLDEWTNEAYESSRLFKEKFKFGMIRKLKERSLKWVIKYYCSTHVSSFYWKIVVKMAGTIGI